MASFLDSLLGSGGGSSSSSARYLEQWAAAQRQAQQQQQGYTAADAESVSQVIARMRQEMDREYGLNKRKLDNEYRTALMNARTSRDVAEANRKYQEGQLQLARDRLAFDKEVQAQEFGLKQANLGYSLVGTLANLRGPADHFQASNYARGVSNQPGTSTFLSALQNNARLSGFGAQQGHPDADNYGTLTQKLTGTYQSATGGTTNASGQSATTGAMGQGNIVDGTVTAASSTPASGQSSDDARLGQIRNLYTQGAHKLNAGALEQLTPSEMGLLKSGIDANGGDWTTFLDTYRRSRVGQNVGMSRAA
jgi:hypothetical protein